MSARLVMLNIPVTDSAKGQAFYGSLLGTTLARSLTSGPEHHHAPASAGVMLDIGAPYTNGQPVIAQFEVSDLAATVQQLQAQGAKVLQAHIDLTMTPQYKQAISADWKALHGVDVGDSLGTAAVIMDPFGNMIGLVQLQAWAAPAFEDGVVSKKQQQHHQVALGIANKVFPHP